MPLTFYPDPAIQPEDSALIDRTLCGDQKAFSQLMQRYLQTVYNYLYRMTQNHELSEEIAQEAFVKAYQNLKNFDRQRPFKPWILRIASNAAISQLRKQSKLVSLNAMEEEGTWTEAQHQTADDVVVQLERKLSTEEVLKALQTLDDKYRQALLLRYQQDLSYEAVAETLGIPLNTVRTWIKRGTEKLKHAVKEMAS
jgi:RNA polymerase sigma-70 factor (ECF subfamily)